MRIKIIKYGNKKIINLLLGLFLTSILVACGGLKQNVQKGNQTGKIEDNKWDYYSGVPVHYTSFTRSLYKDAMNVKNEKTDSFSATFNINKYSDTGVVEFNEKIITIKKTNDVKYSILVDKIRNKSIDKKAYMQWSEYFSSEDGRLIVAIEYKKQIALLSFDDGETIQQIAYYPSRYLACKKIAEVKNQSDKMVALNFLKTALVAGVQSYTSYSRTTIYDNYGNFGYGVTRDYSWAGDRAGDALTTLFNGQYSEDKIRTAWMSLNCW